MPSAMSFGPSFGPASPSSNGSAGAGAPPVPGRATPAAAAAANPAAAAVVTGDRPPKQARPTWSLTVVRSEWLSPSMVRVVFTAAELGRFPDLPHSDHYLKLIFPPAGADYRWPFDPDAIRAERPAEQWPTTRTYTIRSLDRTRNELAIDFVVHGEQGLAGPWAARVRPGDRLGCRGPGGAYTADPARTQLLIGDEAALPAIAATLDRLPAQTRAVVFAEVNGPADEFALSPARTDDATELHWVHRAGRAYGQALVDAVVTTLRSGHVTGQLQAFVHGNADTVRQLRRHLLGTLALDRDAVSISGYWRTDQTEEGWQAGKREFNAEMEADALLPR